jgi:four helix bundle protein
MGNRESNRRPHEGLDVWQRAMTLVELVYACSAAFPDVERFGLTAQIRRSAVSVPSNIAEGAARRSTPDYLRFLSISRGSLSELDTQLQIAARLGYTKISTEISECIDSVFSMLTGLMNSLQTKGAAR